MTLDELLAKLKAIRADQKREMKHARQDEAPGDQDHRDADDLLLEYIGNDEVTEAFDDIDKWYS